MSDMVLIVRASPGCRRPLVRRSVACVTEGVGVVPVVACLWQPLGRGLGQASCLGCVASDRPAVACAKAHKGGDANAKVGEAPRSV